MTERSPRLVRANLVVASDGSTTLGGSSVGLTTQRDRQRFHSLRSKADLIIVGGATARIEPYERTPVTLLVITRGEISGRARANPLARAANFSISHAIQTSNGNILLECGRTLLIEAVANHLVDELHVTYVQGSPNENVIDLSKILENFKEISRDEYSTETFVIYSKSV